MGTLYFLPCGFFLLSFFFLFLVYSQRSQVGCLPYFYTWRSHSANLECRSEMCCTRLAGNTGRNNDAKNRNLRTITQICRAVSSELRHVSTIGKKLVKHQYLPHMFSQYGKLRPTNGWDRFVCLGHPSKFQTVSRLASVTAATSLSGGQPNFAQCLAVFYRLVHIHGIYLGAIARWRNFSRCKIHVTSNSCILVC